MTFAEYFWYLLHRVFKRAPKNSDAEKLAKALGPNYDLAQETIFRLREQSFLATATGKALDQLGRDRGLPRYREETDEEYQLRLLAAYSIHSQIGTAAAMLDTFQRLGFTDAEIQELRAEDPNRWAEFRVNLPLPEASFTEAQRTNLLNTISRMKPAHTKLAGLNIEAPARDIGADPDLITWGEQVTTNLFACPLPAESLYPAEDLYPC